MESWQPVTRVKFGVWSLCLGLFVIIILRNEPGYIPLLDGANLLFHEAGHIAFGLLGRTTGLYGGTLGQFVFPVVVIIGFWRERAPVSFAAGWVWFFENFFNVARYVADARDQVLPLVGGGEHDWFAILCQWHMLYYDTRLAALLQVAGWTGIIATWCWLAWQALMRDTPVRDDTTR
jgi:hypothetical protein